MIDNLKKYSMYINGMKYSYEGCSVVDTLRKVSRFSCSNRTTDLIIEFVGHGIEIRDRFRFIDLIRLFSLELDARINNLERM